jgi:tetratricopeptide (TPR) repeat protein
MRAYNNLAVALETADRFEEAVELCRSFLELARRIGDRHAERGVRLAIGDALVRLGRWDEAEAELAEIEEAAARANIWVARGQVADARRALEESVPHWYDESRPEARAVYAADEAFLLLAEGKPAEALPRAEAALAEVETLGLLRLKDALATALEAAATLRDGTKLDELLGPAEALPPGHTSPALRALAARYGARRVALRREPGADEGFAAAAGIYRELSWALELGETLVDHAEWLAAEGRAAEAEPLLAEAEEVFERLRATPWVERVARCRTGAGEAVA